jgi:hypothetical protein
MKLLKFAVPAIALLCTLAALPAHASEATFDRTLSASGHVMLHVSTGSGNIHITVGSGNQIHVVGHVKSSHGWGTGGNQEERVRQIAANPPIEQAGSIIRIGAHGENLRNISIDYEIQAPANSYLEASSGSGDIQDDGVGTNARINTGSGNIHASGLNDGYAVETGSGDIVVDGAGSGDVRAHTGSGNIELKNIAGGLRAETGSGDIKLSGQPKAGWHVTTGSGNAEFWPSQTGFDLEASTGSGSIHADGSMETLHTDHHSLNAKLHGGGPSVRIETGSGDIRIH